MPGSNTCCQSQIGIRGRSDRKGNDPTIRFMTDHQCMSSSAMAVAEGIIACINMDGNGFAVMFRFQNRFQFPLINDSPLFRQGRERAFLWTFRCSCLHSYPSMPIIQRMSCSVQSSSGQSHIRFPMYIRR